MIYEPSLLDWRLYLDYWNGKFFNPSDKSFDYMLNFMIFCTEVRTK